MGKGDRFILMDGKGDRFEVEIDSTKRDSVGVIIRRPLSRPGSSPVEITLCQSLLKSRSMDYLIEKTSELGVDRVIPFFSERTVVKLDGDRANRKTRHWQSVAQNAAKQSDRIRPAEIYPPVHFQDLMKKRIKKEVLKIIMWEGEEVEDLKGLLRSSSPSKYVTGMVGPEGGFSKEEVAAAKKAGFASVSLGERILRAETAAIALVATIQYEWGDLSLQGV